MPVNLDIKVNADPTAAGPAVSGLIDSFLHARQRQRHARLENDAREREIDDATALADHEGVMRDLEIEERQLALDEKRTEQRRTRIAVEKERLDLEMHRIECVTEMATRLVDTLYPDAANPREKGQLLRTFAQQFINGVRDASCASLCALPERTNDP